MSDLHDDLLIRIERALTDAAGGVPIDYEASIRELARERDEAQRLRAFDTGTLPLPRGLMLEYARLDALWRRLVQERDQAIRERDQARALLSRCVAALAHIVRPDERERRSLAAECLADLRAAGVEVPR